MKRLLVVVLLLFIVCFSGCGVKQRDIAFVEDSRWKVIYFEESRFGDVYYRYIIVDTETQVCYLAERLTNGVGLTVMLDSDGKPLLYDLDKEQ